jgi:hypothetical protein
MKNILILSHLTILLMLFCSTDLSIGPGLQSMEEIPSSVSRPVLRVTLPASWDENWFASPAVYDLDNDGSNEIIASRHSVLYVWGADNKLKWRAPAGENGSSANDHGSRRMYCSPVVGDLDHDGLGEIAVVYGNLVAVYDHQGNLKAGWPQSFPGSGDEIRSLAAGDLDNDNRYEICVVKTSKGPVTNIWRIDGTVLSGWPQVQDRTARNDFGGYNQNIGIEDLDGDGMKDIVSTYDICHIGIMRSDGSEFTASGFFKGKYASSVPMFHDIALAAQGWGSDGNDRDEFTDSPPVFADVDFDGLPEIILFSDHERAGEYKNRGNSLWILNPDMTRVPGLEKPVTTGMPLYTGYQDNIVQVAPSPCIFTMNTGRPHIIAPSYDGNLYCFGPDGAILWKVQFDKSGSPFIGCSEAAAGDLNNDGVSEIVFCTYSTENGKSHLVILSSDGKLLHRVPLEKRGSMAAPTIADVDNDGVLEIIVSLKDTIGKGAGGVQIFDVPSAKSGRLEWPTGRGNYLRTGLFKE